MLTMDEIVRVADLFVRNGVRKIRLTGGEPTLRRDLNGENGGMGAYRSNSPARDGNWA
jgi:hypothetical protein